MATPAPPSNGHKTNRANLKVVLRVLRRLGRAVRQFFASEVGLRARLLAILLFALLLCINAMNVVISFVGRYFMSAIEQRDMDRFIQMALGYVGVFAIITTIAVFYSFTEKRLALLWRSWMTRRMLDMYLDRRVYQKLASAGTLANPDQRISEDVGAFTQRTISFSLLLLNATLTLVAFSGVLWSISPQLFFVAVAYATFGSSMTVLLGKRLVGLNYKQFDKEANFRAQLVHVRENAESIALLHRERRLKGRLVRSLDLLVDNMKRIIAVQRNLGFFTVGYNYMIQIIPALLVAPLFIQGKVEFGVITQSGVAFAHLMGAFSLIVTQFQSISSYAAVIARLDAMSESAKQARENTPVDLSVLDDFDRVAYEELTLINPEDNSLLINKLTLELEPGSRVLVCGKPGLAKLALFRATAGFWTSGHGRIKRPSVEDILFLPEQPYLPPGTLRELMLRSAHEATVTDEEIHATLQELSIERIGRKAGGLDVEHAKWGDLLTIAEQQLLAITRLLLGKPKFIFLDRLHTTLGKEEVESVFRALDKRGCSLIALGRMDDDLSWFDGILEIRPGGQWLFRQQCPLRPPSMGKFVKS